jgi:hypothetical protein
MQEMQVSNFCSWAIVAGVGQDGGGEGISLVTEFP